MDIKVAVKTMRGWYKIKQVHIKIWPFTSVCNCSLSSAPSWTPSWGRLARVLDRGRYHEELWSWKCGQTSWYVLSSSAETLRLFRAQSFMKDMSLCLSCRGHSTEGAGLSSTRPTGHPALHETWRPAALPHCYPLWWYSYGEIQSVHPCTVQPVTAILACGPPKEQHVLRKWSGWRCLSWALWMFVELAAISRIIIRCCTITCSQIQDKH